MWDNVHASCYGLLIVQMNRMQFTLSLSPPSVSTQLACACSIMPLFRDNPIRAVAIGM